MVFMGITAFFIIPRIPGETCRRSGRIWGQNLTHSNKMHVACRKRKTTSIDCKSSQILKKEKKIRKTLYNPPLKLEDYKD